MKLSCTKPKRRQNLEWTYYSMAHQDFHGSHQATLCESGTMRDSIRAVENPDYYRKIRNYALFRYIRADFCQSEPVNTCQDWRAWKLADGNRDIFH